MQTRRQSRAFIVFTTDPDCDFGDNKEFNDVGTIEEYNKLLNNKLVRIISEADKKVSRSFTKESSCDEMGDSSMTIRHETFLKLVEWEEVFLC